MNSKHNALTIQHKSLAHTFTHPSTLHSTKPRSFIVSICRNYHQLHYHHHHHHNDWIVLQIQLSYECFVNIHYNNTNFGFSLHLGRSIINIKKMEKKIFQLSACCVKSMSGLLSFFCFCNYTYWVIKSRVTRQAYKEQTESWESKSTSKEPLFLPKMITSFSRPFFQFQNQLFGHSSFSVSFYWL